MSFHVIPIPHTTITGCTLGAFSFEALPAELALSQHEADCILRSDLRFSVLPKHPPVVTGKKINDESGARRQYRKPPMIDPRPETTSILRKGIPQISKTFVTWIIGDMKKSLKIYESGAMFPLVSITRMNEFISLSTDTQSALEMAPYEETECFLPPRMRKLPKNHTGFYLLPMKKAASIILFIVLEVLANFSCLKLLLVSMNPIYFVVSDGGHLQLRYYQLYGVSSEAHDGMYISYNDSPSK
ncbi:hypothetical protein RF11_15019 [Thelohanellus kitauei]|uniref:Uncharacterized protein n=1 Tax=Thelohanellus kitauei TaxID=669202 RepID=A0A0C2M9V8_THEKT|nr:hypothetical protein RF11_15019 [Thelohanellus kitauei]